MRLVGPNVIDSRPVDLPRGERHPLLLRLSQLAHAQKVQDGSNVLLGRCLVVFVPEPEDLVGRERSLPGLDKLAVHPLDELLRIVTLEAGLGPRLVHTSLPPLNVLNCLLVEFLGAFKRGLQTESFNGLASWDRECSETRPLHSPCLIFYSSGMPSSIATLAP